MARLETTRQGGAWTDKRRHLTMTLQCSAFPQRRPLVVRSGVDYRYTAMVVDQVDAVDGRYEVLFLGTGEL